MLFKFKKKKIVIDAFTRDLTVYEAFKVKRSSEFVPSWFKALKKYSIIDFARNPSLAPNLKTCPGFVNLYSKGFILPLWADLFIRSSGNGDINILYSDETSSIDFHDERQFEGFLSPYKHRQFKIIGPWILKSKSKVQFLMTGCPWNYPKGEPFVVLPGVVDFRLNCASNVNAYLPFKDVAQEILIPCGSPLAQIIPLSEDDIEIKAHLVSESELNKQRPFASPSASSFVNGYRKALKRID